MTDRIIDGTNIDTSVFSYSAPKAHEAGGKVVNLYNKNFKESLTISTPLILTWGADENKDKEGRPLGKYSMSLQFPTAEYSNPDLEAFLASMRALETKVKADALLYSKEWFGKQHKSADIIDALFNPMLRHPKIKGSEEFDMNKPPTLNIKVPCWKGTWKSEIYDEEGEALFTSKVNTQMSPLDYLKPKTHIIALIQCGGIWFVNGKFSVTWNLKQAMVQKPKSSMEGTCFIKLKSQDKEKLKALPAPEEEVESSAIVEDSDEEVEHDYPATHVVPSKVEPTPVVASKVEPPKVEEEKKVVKKVVKKKTDA
jgi:hypothetical protein